MNIQSVIRALYPPQCLSCAAPTDDDHALCGGCWQDTQFISGLMCSACGTSLVGEDDQENLLCDSCIIAPKPWQQGRAALRYSGVGRKLVLAFKHGDRLDLSGPLAAWMCRAGQALLQDNPIIVPVPLHWQRLFLRKYNQAALLAQQVALLSLNTCCPDALTRCRKTIIQDGMTRQQRFDNLRGSVEVCHKRADTVHGSTILLIDDVMTTGATLSACTETLMHAGATKVNVLVLARVARND